MDTKQQLIENVHIDKSLQLVRPAIFDIFDHLHQNPEVSWKEYKTTSYIRNILQQQQDSQAAGASDDAGIRIHTFDDITGVVAEQGEGPFTVAVRADIDALWQDVRGDGTFQANHSCGHDAHMSMVLGTFLVLRQLAFHPPAGTKIKWIFQPAEETGQGALAMIKKGVIDDVDVLFGVHLRPAEEVPDGQAAPAIQHGSALFIKGRIRGNDTHGARPHLGNNAIEVAASIVHQLKNIYLNPMIPYSVKMTQLSAGGESRNIIPGNATFSLDLRAQTNAIMDQLTQQVEKVIRHCASLHNVDIELEFGERMPAAEIDSRAQQWMAEAISTVLGADQLTPTIITPGGEDFHSYTLQKPELKATMLGLGCDLKPGLHHPHMRFEREAIITGTRILTEALLIALQKGKGGFETR